MLKSVVASYAFIGVDAIDPEFGFASMTLEQSRLKSLMQRARNAVIVADSKKLQPREFTYWSELPEKWRLITDDAADPTALDALRARGSVVTQNRPVALAPSRVPNQL
jgi:DeoR family transcriptional regulator of aga operon